MKVFVLDDDLHKVFKVQNQDTGRYLDYTAVDIGVLNGRKRIECRKCPAGTYIKKDSNKPKFARITCEPCPLGMISTNFDDDVASFLPKDVKDMTSDHNPNFVFPQANYNTFACRACSKIAGVPTTSNTCQLCAANEYQLASVVDTKKGYSLVLGTKCSTCGDGYEFFNWQTRSRTGVCRSTNPIHDCCRICLPNYYSTGGKPCVKVPDSEGTLQPYGATTYGACGFGKQLVYCNSAGVCHESSKIGWRTCRQCTDSNTQRALVSNGCKSCASEQMDLTAQHDKCTSCSGCEEVISIDKSIIVHDINEAFYASIEQVDSSPVYTYTRDVVIAECKALQRRSVKNNVLIAADYHRERGKEPELVPVFYTLLRSTATNCTKIPCAHVCHTRYFEYSPGCGQQETNLQIIWVLYQNTVRQYKTLTTQQQTEQLNVHHGPCKLCKTCSKGAYNGLCNAYVSGSDPQGSCQACKTSCPQGFFLHHPVKDAGCHAPPPTQLSANNMWKISADYLCSPCPTWVQQDDSIRVVSACGVRQSYTGWAWDENSRLIAKQLDVSFSNWQRDLAELGETYRNYRSFMHDLVPYCPAGYYYDEEIVGCELREPQSFRVPGTATQTVGIGFDVYNPQCCQTCTTCSYVQKKDTSNWKACTGDSLTDTQNACVERCGAMYWENQTARECRRCSTCEDGFLPEG